MDNGDSYVLIVEDHPLVADSVSACVRLCDPDVGVQIAESLRGAHAILKRHPCPRLIVTDLTLTDAHGDEAVRTLREAAPASPLLVVTALDDPALRDEANRLGVAGYVVKSASTSVLRDHVAEILNVRIAEQRLKAPVPPRRTSLFTRKQLQVLEELVAGRSNREIAARLNIAPETVGSHMKEILARLGVKNRTEAVVRYLDMTGQHQGRSR